MSKLRNLTKEQECQRMEGLHILARIIARHYLAHPELYPLSVDPDGGSKESGKEGVK